MKHDDPTDKSRSSQTRWRRRLGVRAAAVGVSLLALGAGASLVDAPVHAATTSPSAQTAPYNGPQRMMAGWGG